MAEGCADVPAHCVGVGSGTLVLFTGGFSSTSGAAAAIVSEAGILVDDWIGV